jgi:hypothetical protein
MRCILPFPAYEAGSVAVFYLYDAANIIPSTLDLSNTVFFVQIHGHIQVNDRWLKMNDKLSSIFLDNDDTRPLVEHVQVLPADPRSDRNITTSASFFASSKVPVSPYHLLDSGVFLEVSLPYQLLSSFKSRSMNVDYYVSLYIQSLSYQKNFHFPITIHSRGTSQNPYPTRFASLLIYPADSIPVDSQLNNEFNFSSSSDTVHSESHSSKNSQIKSFNVRDKDHVCVVHLSTTNFQVGKEELLVYDFSKNQEACEAIKATILLCEKRNHHHHHSTSESPAPDQERIICTRLKRSEDAYEMVLDLTIPEDCYYSFRSPLLSIEYKLILEFYLTRKEGEETAENGDNNADEITNENNNNVPPPGPLSFTIPLVVNSHYLGDDSPQAHHHHANNRRTHYTKPQLQTLCLEAKYSSVGVIIESVSNTSDGSVN